VEVLFGAVGAGPAHMILMLKKYTAGTADVWLKKVKVVLS
jgi:hypothetical protein